MKKKFTVKQITLLAMLLSLALVLSIAESFIPFGIPGLKLGLANMVILLAIYYFGFWVALAIDILRVVISSIAVGTFLAMGFAMSMAGALLSFFVMYIFYRWFKAFTPVGTSVAGAYSHALAQIIVGVIYLGNWGVFYYFPVMAIASLITGTFNGFIVELILQNKYLATAVGYEKSKTS